MIGLVIVRVPGIAFGMLTLAVGQMAYLAASRSRGLTGGADGMIVDWPSTLFGVPTSLLLKPAGMLVLGWSCAGAVARLALALLLRSRFGAITEAIARQRGARALHRHPDRCCRVRRCMRCRPVSPRWRACSSALNTGFVSPENLHWSLSGVALMMVVVGGTRVLWGPAFGAAVYFLAKDVLGEHAQHWMAIFGIALIVVIVFAPEGLSGVLRRLVGGRRPAARSGSGPARAAH